MHLIGQDIRYAARMLVKSPVVTGIAVASLALGIGANTAIFTLLNALILRPLPIRDPAQMVRLSTTRPEHADTDSALSLSMFRQLRKEQRVFSDLFAWTGGGIVNIEANGVKYAASMSTVSGEYFSTLGIRPVLGRLIAPDDLSLDTGFPAAVAVLDYRCWQRRYNGAHDIIGKTIHVENRALTIIGVTPEDFTGLVIEAAPDVTVPISYSGRTTYRDPKYLGLDVFGRLKPRATIEQARAQLESVWPAIRLASLPDDYRGSQREAFLARGIVLQSAATGTSFLRERYRRPLVILMAMVGLLLLIACVNLANLMLARAAGRRREFGIRVALGAARWRLIGQTLTESLILSVTGAVIGLAVAYWASRLLMDIMWTGLVPLAIDPAPDLRVLTFTAVVSVFTGILFGLSPAWSIRRTDPGGVLQQNARTVVGGAGSLSKFLVTVQVALSLVLVIGAALFVRSLESSAP